MVDRKSLRVRFNRPIIVGIMFCICLRARALVKLGWVVKKLTSIALHKVETGGYPAAACRKWFGFVIFLVISTQCNWVGSWLGNCYEPQSWWFASTSENGKGLVMNINIGGFHYIDGGAVEDSGSAVITEFANG